MTQEALRMALEHIEGNYTVSAEEAITAIKEALAQEQEPVAWQWLDTAHFRKKLPKDAGDGVWNPLYAAPQRTWVGLFDEEIWQIATGCTIGGDLHADKFARAIESKLKEVNT